MGRLAAIALVLVVSVARGPAATVYEVYRVQPGDTVESIAASHGIPADELRKLNPHLLTGTLTPYELVTVPQAASDAVLGSRHSRPGASGPARGGVNGVNQAGTIRPSSNGRPRVLGPGDDRAEAVEDLTAPMVGGGTAAGGQSAKPGTGADQDYTGNGVVGRLGVVRADKTSIFRQRSSEGRPVFRCQKGQQLVIIRRLGDWVGAMMVDNTTGWLPASAVDVTDTPLVKSQLTQTGSACGQAVVQTAFQYLGAPYVWGGESMRGIDCSGLVLKAHQAHGVNLPRVAREQFLVGRPVAWNQLQPGDRLYFASNGSRIDHTGLYIGNGQFIHASGRRDQVAVDNLFQPRYWSMFVGAKR